MLPNPYTMGFSPNAAASRYSGPNGRIDDDLTLAPIGPESHQAVPQVLSFNAILGTAWRTYWHGRYDEALRHSQENADAMYNDPFIRRVVNERKLAVQSLGCRVEVDNERDPWQKAIKDGLTQLYRAIPRGTDLRWYLLESVFVGRYAAQMTWAFRNINLPALPQGGEGMMALPGRGDTQRMRAMTLGLHMPYHGDKLGFNFDGTPYVLVSALAAAKHRELGGEIMDPNKADDDKGWYPPLKAYGADMGYTTVGGRALFLRSPSWRQRFAIHQHEILDQEFWNADRADIVHGIGIRSTIYWYWWLRQEFLSNVTDWCARTGLGVRLWYFQSGNDQSFQNVNKAARQQSDKVNILIPRTEGGSEEVAFVDTSGTGAELLLKIVKHLEEHIELYVLGQSMSKGNDDGGNELGGTGRANFARSTKHQITKYDAEKLGDTITEDILKVFLRWTYGPEFADLPVRLVYNVDNPDPKAYLEAAKTFVEMGGTVRESDAREVIGFDEPHEGDKLLGGQEQTGAPIVGPDGGHHPGTPGPTTAPNAQPQAQPVNGQPHTNGMPQRFSRSGAIRYGAWITIGAREGGDGKKHGGSHVYIENGQITKGAPKLAGKKLEQGKLGFGASSGHVPEDVASEAKKEGIRTEDLSGLAKQFLEHDQEFKRDETDLIQEVRKYHPEYQQRAKQLQDQGRDSLALDASGQAVLRTFDTTSGALANRSEYAHLFAGKNASEYLFDLLGRGNPQPMTNQEAYQQALDYLVEAKAQGQYEVEHEGTDFPFGANAPAGNANADQIFTDHYGTAEGAAVNFAKRMGVKDQNAIDDMKQEALLKLHDLAQKQAGAQDPKFPGLVKTAIENHLRDRFRSERTQKRGAGKVQSLGEHDVAAPRQEEGHEEGHEEAAAAIRAALPGLPEDQRMVVLAREAGEPLRVIGERMGIGKTGAHRLLEQARKSLRHLLPAERHQMVDQVIRYGLDDHEPERYEVQAPIRDDVWQEILEQSKTYGPRAGEFIRAVMEAMRDSPSQWEAITKGRQAFLAHGAARFQQDQARAAIMAALPRLKDRFAARDAIRSVLVREQETKQEAARRAVEMVARQDQATRQEGEAHRYEQERDDGDRLEREQRDRLMESLIAKVEQMAQPDWSGLARVLQSQPPPVFQVPPVDLGPIADAIRAQPAPVVNYTPEAKPRKVKIVRGPDGYTAEVED